MHAIAMIIIIRPTHHSILVCGYSRAPTVFYVQITRTSYAYCQRTAPQTAAEYLSGSHDYRVARTRIFTSLNMPFSKRFFLLTTASATKDSGRRCCGILHVNNYIGTRDDDDDAHECGARSLRRRSAGYSIALVYAAQWFTELQCTRRVYNILVFPRA